MISFFSGFIDKRYVIAQLVKRDFNDKYVDSYLGLSWAVLEPIATTTILSVVFSYGFKVSGSTTEPFFIFMLTGMVAFNYFSAVILEGSQCIREYSFLVKKISFNVYLLPFVKIFSRSLFHLVMLGVLVVALIANGVFPSFFWFQAIYYFLCMNLLLLGVTLILSSLSVFVPDLKYVITITMQFLFYATPIFWRLDMLPESLRYYVKFNPMYYVVQGYRDSFLYNTGFWEKPVEALFFLIPSLILLLLGASIFKRSKGQFADVL